MLLEGFFESFYTPLSTFANSLTPNCGHFRHLAAWSCKANTKY